MTNVFTYLLVRPDKNKRHSANLLITFQNFSEHFPNIIETRHQHVLHPHVSFLRTG